MRILQFCHKSPFPPKEGGPIATNNITQGLIDAGHSVKVFAISTPKYKVEPDKIQQDYINKTGFEFIYIDTSVKCTAAFLNLFSNESYNINRFYSKHVENKLVEILNNEEFDIVQLESLFVTPYLEVIRKYSKAKIVLRSHNIEFLVWERLSKNYKNPLIKLYINVLARKLKQYEISMLNKYDGITTITKEDAEYKIKCGCSIPIVDIPFGINLNNYLHHANPSINQEEQRGEISLFFIGSMDWKPNQKGLKWFLTKVWGEVSKQHNILKCYIAGRNFPAWLKNWKAKNLVVVGEVENAINFISSKSIMIVPLFSGSGVRVKIIEGMALGKTVISTSTGAEGINYENRKNILIADTEKEFIDSISYCIGNNEFCKQIGENAIAFVRTEHNNILVIQKLVNFYNMLIG